MAYRSKISKKKSKRLFIRTASRTHKKNISSGKIMRGGYRI